MNWFSVSLFLLFVACQLQPSFGCPRLMGPLAASSPRFGPAATAGSRPMPGGFSGGGSQFGGSGSQFGGSGSQFGGSGSPFGGSGSQFKGGGQGGAGGGNNWSG